ncbi:glycosyltransferase family protein [Afifella pfennigii]|uniref:glycosyltransferase family protein n=1 Tax=Afifella pfennigii TaxID=209897 RepID=UPI00047CBD17|nr:glycosyltransferase [Afifella pfennigii]
MIQRSRILIYSHDTFGLGHLRRCQALAAAIVDEFEHASVMILSGSPIIGSFEYCSRVDFVRVPGVIKLRNGEYTSLNPKIDISETLSIRSSIIEHTASIYRPDIFIVDKEPYGLRGEVRPTLSALKRQGTQLVLGLRDVLDDQQILATEWTRKEAYDALTYLYDEIWVYGLKSIYDPLAGLPLPETVRQKMVFTGYLRRHLPKGDLHDEAPFEGDPYIIVTPGGGADGMELVDWVLRAYEAQERALYPALIVLGPFMSQNDQLAFMERAGNLRNVKMIRFTPQLEPLIDKAIALVGMGGYNTFCEALSFDKPTLLIPRIVPRREQAIRAERAEALGLATHLPIDRYPDVTAITDALAKLPERSPPSASQIPGLLDGWKTVHDRIAQVLEPPAIKRSLP